MRADNQSCKVGLEERRMKFFFLSDDGEGVVGIIVVNCGATADPVASCA